jgi:outer membrane protein, multidrug efflux system
LSHFRFLACSVMAFILSCCSVGPRYVPPPTEIPSNWKNFNSERCQELEVDDEGGLCYLDYWWEVFDDAKLNELEALAIQNNRDLFVAFERVQEAVAQRGIAASSFYPQVTLNPLYTNTGELIKNYTQISPTLTNLIGPKVFRVHELLYFLPANLSYEVDLWGKIQDQYDNANYSLLAQQKDYESVMLSLTSNLAIAYYQLRGNDAQIDLLAQILKTRQKAYEINKDRFEAQITFYADVTLAAEEVESAKIQYEEALRARTIFEDQIAVLLGVPASEFYMEHSPLQTLPPCIPDNIPSEVLVRRPDVAEAEFLAQAQHALVKEAYSLFFPSLTLTASGGFESPVFKDFLKWISRYWMDGVQINQLIFDGFKTPYNLDLQIARFREASGEYQQQILIAFQEVEDALNNVDSYAKQYNAAAAASQWSQKTNQLYSDRYKLGVIYYIDVANTERDSLNFQANVISLQASRFVATIQLIKALGGGW